MARTLSEHAAEETAAPNTIDKQALEDFFVRLNNLHDDFDDEAARFRADVKALYAEAADTLKVNRKIIRHAYTTIRAQAKLQKREAALEAADRDQLDLLRAALGDFIDTPLGQSALS